VLDYFLNSCTSPGWVGWLLEWPGGELCILVAEAPVAVAGIKRIHRTALFSALPSTHHYFSLFWGYMMNQHR